METTGLTDLSTGGSRIRHSLGTKHSMLRSSPLFQLYLVRLRDFYRQPARVFWVYGFPTILAVALGFAFQESAARSDRVDLVEQVGRRRGQGCGQDA